MGIFRGLNKLIYVKLWEQALAHSYFWARISERYLCLSFSFVTSWTAPARTFLSAYKQEKDLSTALRLAQVMSGVDRQYLEELVFQFVEFSWSGYICNCSIEGISEDPGSGSLHAVDTLKWIKGDAKLVGEGFQIYIISSDRVCGALRLCAS